MVYLITSPYISIKFVLSKLEITNECIMLMIFIAKTCIMLMECKTYTAVR